MAKVTISVIDFLTRAAFFIRKDGYITRGQAEENNVACTADDTYFSLTDRESIEEQEEDANMAQSALDWALEQSGKLLNAVSIEVVDFGAIDLLASVIPAFEREQRRQEALNGANEAESSFVGREGARINPPGSYGGERVALGPVKIIDNFQYRKGRLVKGCVKFLTEDGDVLVWWTTPRTDLYVIGDRVMLVNALIKGHSTYEGVDQTSIGCPQGHRGMVRKLTR